MEDNTPRYIVSFSNGKVAKLSEQEYNDSKNQIYQFDNNASAARINDFSFDDDVDENATYTVGLPNGKFSVFSAQQYRDSRDELRKVDGIQIGSLSPVDYWGDKLADLNKQIGELEPQYNAAVEKQQSVGNNNFTDEDMDTGEAIRSASEGLAAASNTRELKKRLTALKEEREANPAYQSARQRRIEGLQGFTSDIDKQLSALDADNPESAKILRTPHLSAVRGAGAEAAIAIDMRKHPEYYRDSEALQAARLWVADAERAEKAPSRYDSSRTGFQNFLSGVTGNVKDLSTVLGLAKGFARSMPLIDTVKQIQAQEGNDANIMQLVEQIKADKNALPYMSDAQKTLLKAFVVKTLTDAERAGDTSLGYQAGQGAIASLGFMKDFLLTGGEGSIANAAAKGAAKWMTKGLAKASLELGMKGAAREAAMAVPKFAVGTVKGAVKTAVMTPFMPSSYKNLLDNLTQMNVQDGTVDLSGKSAMQAVGDVFIENFSENAGGQVETILGVPFKALGAGADKVFANTAFSTWGKAIKNAPIANILKQAGFNGYIGEIGEEWYGNALRVMTGVDKDALKNFATVDQQIITLTSFAPMSIFGLGASSGQYLAAKKQMDNAGEALSKVLAKNGYGDEQIASILAVTKAENPTELGKRLAPVVNQIAADNGDASEAYKAVCDFAKAIAQYRTFDGMREADAEQERLNMAAAIDAELGGERSFDDEGKITGNSQWMQTKTAQVEGGEMPVRSVRVLTDTKGIEYFVQSGNETDGYGAVRRSDGTHRIINAEELESGAYTDSGNISLDAFLDREIARKRGVDDNARVEQETAQNGVQIYQQAQPGMQINVGTVENPVTGTVVAINPGDRFVVQSESGAKEYTLEEMAQLLQMPLRAQTAQEIDDQTAETMNRISEKKNSLNQRIITGSAGNLQFDGKAVVRVLGQDENGNISLLVEDAEGNSDRVEINEEQLDALVAQSESKPVVDVLADEQEKQQEPKVEGGDNVSNDFRGNPLPLRTNKRTGLQVVDENALWNRDPEAWAVWNDTNPNAKVSSKERLEFNIGELIKEIEKDTKAVQKAALKGTDADQMDDMEYALGQKIGRRDLLNSILTKYNMPVAPAADTFAGEQRRKAAQEAIAAAEAGMPTIQAKWENAPKIDGNADEIVLADSSTIRGHYILTEAQAPTPSHNPANGFKMTEGFPVDENGKTVNDRDYEHDKAAQQAVMDKAANYDQRALQTPVIVSNDGVVLSGNDRTMASQIAAQNGSDGAYVEYLAKYPQKYGFSPEQVGQFAHPRVAFVPDEALPYDAPTFAKFNAEDKKSQSKTEKAVKAGKTISPEALGQLATLINEFEDVNDLYNDEAGVQGLISIMLSDGIITQDSVAGMMDGKLLSGTGMDMLESTLIGAALDEEAVRIAMADKSLRKPIVSAIAQIIANNTIEGYTLRTEVTDAIALLANGKGAGEIKFGESVQGYIRQFHLFEDDVVASATVQMLADAINDRKTSFLKKVLSLYNRDSADASMGQVSWLDDGTTGIPTRQYILRNILESLGYDTSILTDTSDREAEQRAAAEAAEQGTGGETQTRQDGSPVQGDAAGQVSIHDREEVAARLEEGHAEEHDLVPYMTDEEVAEFLRLWNAYEPAQDALGQAYSDLDADLKSADKKVKAAAEKKIKELQEAQIEAFAPVSEYVNGLIEQYGLKEGQEKEAGLAETEEEDSENPGPPKPRKGKDGKPAGNQRDNAVKPILRGDFSDATLAAAEYTTDEEEQFIYGASLFGEFSSRKTSERIEIVYCDDAHPVYHDHSVLFGIWDKGEERIGDRKDGEATTDFMLRYLKANGFKLTSAKSKTKKNNYGYYINENGLAMNPIRVEPPKVAGDMSEINFWQDDDGKWCGGGFTKGGGTLTRVNGLESKSTVIKTLLDALEKNDSKADALIRIIKTKTLPQALLEEGVVTNVPRAEITASEFDDAEQGLLFGEQELNEQIIEETDKVDTNPTEGQKKAGNYKMGHVKIGGLDISIENPKGSIRKGTDESGKEWQTTMANNYGYIRMTEGVDGDKIDIFLSDAPKRGKVFVIDQVNPSTGAFDEHKVMYGFANEEEARAAYLANYEKGWKGLGAITPVTKAEFKKWIDSSGRKTKPFAEYKSVKVDASDANDSSEELLGANGLVLEETEGTPGNYHWNEDGICTNPTIITLPGADRLGAVNKIALAENEGKWHAEGYLIADGGRGSSWGHRIPQLSISGRAYGSRHAAVQGCIDSMRWMLDNVAKKQSAAYGETFNEAGRFLDMLIKTEFEASKGEDNRIETIAEGLKAFDKAKGNAKKSKFAQLVKAVGEMLDFADDVLNSALKDAAKQFRTEQGTMEPERANAYYVRRVRNALKEATGNRSMTGYNEVQTETKHEEAKKPATPAYGSQNKVISTEKYQELLKQWKAKQNNLNSGFDPEALIIGAQLGAYHIEAGARQFLVFSTNLLRDAGESIRPYLKSIYNAVRDWPGMEPYKAEMDTQAFVDEVDVSTITDVQPQNEPVSVQEEDTAENTNPVEIAQTDAGNEQIAQGIAQNTTETEQSEEEEQVSENIGQLGELGKYTHTKTGKEMSIVRLTGDRLSNDEFKRLKARAKEFGGYYSSFKGAGGFLFDNEEDAIKFNTINTPTNVSENTDRKTAADTAAVVSEGASAAIEAETLAESEEQASEEQINTATERIDAALEAIDDQLALLGYYEADQTGPFHERYGYMKSAEKKAVKDADRLAKKLAKDLGIEVGRKPLAKANIAPAGGEVYFSLPLNEGHELYMDISLVPNADDDLFVGGVMGRKMAIYFRMENPTASGSERYVTRNNFQPYNVKYSDLLKAIRRDACDFLPEQAAAEPVSSTTDILQVAKEQAEKNRKSGKSKKNPVSSQEDGDAALGSLFATLYDAEEPAPEADESPAPAAPARPAEVNGYKKGDKVIYAPDQGKSDPVEATIYDFEHDGRPILDLGLAPVLYEVTDWEKIKPLNSNDNGQNNQRRPSGSSTEPRSNGRGSARGEDEREGKTRRETRQDGGRADNGGESGGGLHPGSGRSVRRIPRLEDQNKRNYRPAKDATLPRTPVARYKANVAAIRLLKELQDSGKPATKEQMAILAQYTGWGGLGGYFNNEYSPEYGELKQLLTDEEMSAAALSGNTAYYTPAAVIDSMWEIAKRMGFDGGSVLEGSAGVGNILAQMPKAISERSAITAVELDSITGGMLGLLYPDANVMVKGFEEADIPNGSVDLAITNVPFGDIHVYDAKEKDLTRKFGAKIHDFCIAKNIRKLREGGIGVFISTRGTLDNSSKTLRNWIVNEGGTDVIGAFRLNNATFEGTGATSDIIVVRKRVNGKVSTNAIDISTTQITRRETFDAGKTEWDRSKRKWVPVTGEAVMEINSYYAEHPENMGGEMGFGYEHEDTYRPASAALWPAEKIDQGERLAKWAKQFAAENDEAPMRTQLDHNATLMEAEAAGMTKEGQIILNSKGEVCVNRYGKAMPLNGNAQKVKGYSKAQVVADYDALKTAINEVLDYQLKNESDEGLKPLIAQLNRAYDMFRKRYGQLNRNTAISFLRNDVDFPAIAAVENYEEKKSIDGKVTVEVKKTGVFSGRVIGAKRVPTPTSAKDGVIVSVNQFGRIDIPFIAQALKADEATVRSEILSSGLGFENPLTGEVEVEYEYLSGNVREKLEYAREHNTGGKYDANIKALEKAVPAEIPAHLIEFSLGSDWLPVSLYTEYAKEKFGLTDKFAPQSFGGGWSVSAEDYVFGARNEKNRSAGVTSELLNVTKQGHELMLAAMNKTTVQFSRTYKDSEGRTHTEHDKEASLAAATKIDEMREDFKEWCRARILGDDELNASITKTYNDTFNAIAPKEIGDAFIPNRFDGQALELDGKPFHLYPHQAKAVIRASTEPLMMAHEVGTGKTFTLITTAMEMRRLGNAKKPMIVVQNATLGQFVSSAKELYPNAKVLTISEADRTAEGRAAFHAKIKYNDWDIIIVPQSVFEMIPDSEERKRAFVQEKIDEKMMILEQAKAAKNQAAERRLKQELEDLEYERDHDGEKRPRKGRGEKTDAKKVEVTKANAAARAKKQLDRRTDDVSDFDEMGIDALLIDEAHAYKHLGFSTAMQRGVKGVDPSYSKKSASLYLKTRSVFDKVGWKNVVFATGTPISNTAAEIWTFMKYLMPGDVMRSLHIYYFDDFVSNFGNISQSLEFTTSGKFRENSRFASYANLPELIRMWASVTDTVLTKEAIAAGGEKLEDKVPVMETWTDDEGEKHENEARDVYLPQSPALTDILTAIRARLEWYEGLTGKEKKENSHVPLVMFGLAKMASIDPRLVDRNAKDEPLSKTNRVVEETMKALEDSKRYNGTAALFCDNFRRWDTDAAGNRVEGFSIFEEIKRKLIAAGVPESQIVIMRSGMTTAAKEKIFARVNAGEVRVIMGTTATLGTGVNIQERLFFEAHIDAPNRPMDYTQRMGRILRQGNLHKEWDIPVRVVRLGVEDSLDVTAYQRLSTKSKFINSVMDGKPLLANGMENRILEEEEEGEFDNPVAVLSGSQYALLKSQAERELRKLRNKKEQHRQDQIYIERALKENESRIAYDEKLIEDARGHLASVKEAFPDGVVNDITIEGRNVKGSEQISEAIKKKITGVICERLDRRRNDSGFSNEELHYAMTFDGVPVDIKVGIERSQEWNEMSRNFRPVMRTRIEYSCHRLGVEGRFVQGGYSSIKDIVTDFTDRIASGRYFDDAVTNITNTVNRLNADNELMIQRRGKPFADEDKLAQQEAIVKDYAEKMRAELAEKEAKHAETAKNAKTNFNLDNVEIDDEEEGEDAVHDREADEDAPKLDVNNPLVLTEAIAAVNRLARKLGLRIVYDSDLEGKGAYAEGTDYVRINLANCESVDDAVETLLHEGVAHFGLREMLGEDGMKEFIADILAKAAPSIRAKIEQLAADNGWSIEYAAEEYVAELAQKTDYARAERSFWRDILNAVRNLIARITGRDTYITDDVIREMLIASYGNLEERTRNLERGLYRENPVRIDGEGDVSFAKRCFRELEQRGYKGLTKHRLIYKGNENTPAGDFDAENDIIRIFAYATDTFEDHEGTFFHENLHAYLAKNGHGAESAELSNLIEFVRGIEPGMIGDLEHEIRGSESYKGKFEKEEAFVRLVESLMQDESVNTVLAILPKESARLLKDYFKAINYDAEAEQIRRGRQGLARQSEAERADGDSEARMRNGEELRSADEERGDDDSFGRERVTHYRVRIKPAPEKTAIGYKVFYRGRDGKLYPPMVANPNGDATPVGVWLDADAAPVAGQSKTGRPRVKAGGKGTQGGSGSLAYRPGWHLGEIPYAIQFNRVNPANGRRELFPRDFAWAEVEYAADKDYQQEAEAEGMTEGGKYRHSYAGLKEVPEDGFYRYRTNPNPETDPWIITGAMKVNRILNDEEVDELVRAAGREPQKREPSVTRNRVAHHGSIADFDAFDIDHAGEGEGFAAHGYGHYVSFGRDTAVGYAWRNAFNLADRKHLIEHDVAEMLRNEAFDDYDTMVSRYDELLADKKERTRKELEETQRYEPNEKKVIEGLTEDLDVLEGYEPLEEVFRGMRNLYTVEIPEDTGTNYLDEKGETPKSVVSRIYDALNKLAKDKKNKELAERIQIKKPIIEQIYGEKGEIRTGGDLYGGLSLILGSVRQASEFLHDIGIVGIKYDGRSDGQCAVIFSNSDIVISEHERWREGGDYSNPSPVWYKESIGARRLSASETASKFGVSIEFRPSSEMRQDGKPLAGRWVDGKIYICLEHCRDNDDAVRTVLHEGVGHQGLRRLIGNDNMREFCLDIFRNAPAAVRNKIAKDAVEKYGGNVVESVERFTADDVIREVGGNAVFESAEEWMAETSETIDYDDYRRNLWDIICSALRKVLAKVGINISLSVRDVKWLMVQSSFANHETDALVEARRQVVAKELGFTLRQQAEKGEAMQIARNRLAEEELAPAARIYNKDVMYWLSRLHETWVDKDEAVHKLVVAIEKATGKKAATFEDVRLALNHQSSKGLAAIEEFEMKCYNPMMDAIKSLMKAKGVALSDMERYVMIKHGLERNEVFAARDAREYYQDLHDGAVRAIENSDQPDAFDKKMLIEKEDAKLKKHLKAIEAKADAKYKEFRQQDYGGLTAMYSEWDAYEPFMEGMESEEEFQARVLQARHPKYTYVDDNGRRQVDMAATENAAMQEVAAFEDGFNSEIEELWKRINAATKHTIKHQYDANMMSRDQYLRVRDMFKYYVPLRGFADNTAENMYDYYRSDQRNDFTPPLLKAKGRKSEAESPFGYIGAMASSGIAADMKNETKLALYYFVSNRANNDLVSISEVWYKAADVDELGRMIFTPVYPPLNEDLSSEEAKKAYEDWEKEMQEEAKAGFAFKGTRKLDLHHSVIHIDERQKSSHVIKFKVGGRDMMMYINGNPRAAQAINNELNVEMSADYQRFFGKILRWFSGINTSYNPEFWLSNAQRDALFALMSVDVKEDAEYGRAFRKNFGRILGKTLIPGAKGGAYSLMKRLENGELGDAEVEGYYKEFVENGGVTGYTTLKNNEEWELELRQYTGETKRAVKAVKSAFDAVQGFGEAIEQMTRFAAYMTSRQQGRGIKDAVADAKELTVNFNRKGSGQAITFKEAARLRTKDGKKLTPFQRALVVAASWLPVYGRRFIMFFNASTQGLNAMYKLYRKNPARMGIWTAGYLMLGVVQAILHAMMDDDDDYLDIPDYERRNNLLLGAKGAYFKWALPQEARVFYAMGDMAVNHAMGREPHKNMLTEIVEGLSDIAPLNPAGGVSAIAPSALTPVVEVLQNRDYKGAKIYNDLKYLSDEERKRTPAYQKAYQGTGKPYMLISQFANWLTGGDYADAGWLNINPAAVEHIVNGATGGAGTTIGKFYRGTIGQALGEDFVVRNAPFVSRILTVNDDRYRNAHTTELFDYYKAEAEHTKKLINAYRKNGDDKKLNKLFDGEDYEIMVIYESYRGMLKYYNEELKATTDKKERKALMREQDAVRKEMILEISNIGKND